MIEVRQHADGRVAVHTPSRVDTLEKGDCNWLAISWPDNVLHVELLTDEDVRDWTPFVEGDA